MQQYSFDSGKHIHLQNKHIIVLLAILVHVFCFGVQFYNPDKLTELSHGF